MNVLNIFTHISKNQVITVTRKKPLHLNNIIYLLRGRSTMTNKTLIPPKGGHFTYYSLATAVGNHSPPLR